MTDDLSPTDINRSFRDESVAEVIRDRLGDFILGHITGLLTALVLVCAYRVWGP